MYVRWSQWQNNAYSSRENDQHGKKDSGKLLLDFFSVESLTFQAFFLMMIIDNWWFIPFLVDSYSAWVTGSDMINVSTSLLFDQS